MKFVLTADSAITDTIAAETQKELNVLEKYLENALPKALDFAIDELGLYLVTHADDQEALELYWSYIRMAKEGRKKYEAAYGPLQQTTITEGGYRWLDDPWPWEKGGNH